MKTYLNFILIFLVCGFSNLYGQVVINEVSNNNSTTILDGAGKANDWIELYNSGTSSLNLLHYSITDDSTNLKKWKFPNINIAPKAFLVLMASGRNTITPLYIHINFKLSQAGETLILCDSNKTIIDKYHLDSLHTNNAFGRSPDGAAKWCLFDIPTPKASNNKSVCYNGYEPEPIFSIGSGFYPTGQMLAITSSSSTAIIKYTLNGDFPGTASFVYTKPISFGKTIVVSARSFSKNKTLLPSNFVKNTYFINEKFDLPVFSISMNPKDLWDFKTGIYVFGPNADSVIPYRGANFWQDWEKLSHIEYFDKQKHMRFESDAGIKISGAYSRDKPQKSFGILFDKFSGASNLNFPLIPDKSHITKYKSFTLRNTGQDFFKARLRDAFMERVMKYTHSDYMAYEPAIVFLNGVYWGQYEIREKQNTTFIELNNGVPENKVDFLEHSGRLKIKAGSDTSFYTMYNYISRTNPLNPDFYNRVDKMLDLENFTDYFIAETYFCNNDWISEANKGNNFRLWHSQLPGGKWRYILWDLDQGSNYSARSAATVHKLSIIKNRTVPNEHAEIFNTLLKNTQFRYYFVNRYADLMNTIFQIKNMKKIGYSMRDSIKSSIARHVALWGKSYADWYGEVNTMINFNIARVPETRKQIISEYKLVKQVNVTLDVFPAEAGKIKISTIIPDSLPWTGVYFDGVPVTIVALPNLGYTFQYWDSNHMINPADSMNPQVTLNINANNKFTAYFSGASILHPLLTFSEINYHSDATVNSGEWIELHNYGDIPIDLSFWQLKNKDSLNVFEIPEGNIIQPNGYIVFVTDQVKFNSQYPNVKNYVAQLPFGFKNSTDQIRLCDNFHNLKLAVSYSDSIPWPKGADGNGRTLELIDPTEDINNGLNWIDGCMGGSPGKAYAPCQESVIFSEVNYHPALLSDAGDWVELHNLTSKNIDISGWNFQGKKKDSIIYVIPAKTILSANGYMVICNDVSKFTEKYPIVSNFAGPFNFKLDRGGELMRLRDKKGKLQFSMIYSDSLPWPMEPDGKGKTLEILNANGIVNNGLNWFAGCLGGSPGRVYSPCNPVNIIASEINYKSLDSADAGDWLEVHSLHSDTINLSNWILKFGSDPVLHKIRNNTKLAPNDYLVLGNDSAKFRKQHPDSINYVGSIAFDLPAKESVSLYDSTGFLQFSMSYDNVSPWPLDANGKGKTLELLNPSGNLSSGLNWFSGCHGGSPGKAYSPCLEKDIVFNEINYNSSPSADAGDWVEFHNVSSDSIDISGWNFTDSLVNDNYYFPANTVLSPSAYIVLSNNINMFKLLHPGINNYVGPFNFDLTSVGEKISLLDQRGIMQMSVKYNAVLPWPADANGKGKTLELIDAKKDLNDGYNWLAGCPGGSPGKAYNPVDCNDLGIMDAGDDLFKVNISSNPSVNSVNIEIVSKKLKDISYSVFDIKGREIKRVESLLSPEIIIRKEDLGSGIYLVKINDYSKRYFITEKIIFQ